MYRFTIILDFLFIYILALETRRREAKIASSWKQFQSATREEEEEIPSFATGQV